MAQGDEITGRVVHACREDSEESSDISACGVSAPRHRIPRVQRFANAVQGSNHHPRSACAALILRPNS